MKRHGVKSAILIVCLGAAASLQAQGVKVGGDPGDKNPNSALELQSTNQGFVAPRVALTGTSSNAPLNAGSGPLTGTIVYNTASAGSGSTAVSPGFYYWDGSAWQRLQNASQALSASSPLSYNSGTGVLSISQAGSSTDGYLSSTHWNTFNNKENPLTAGSGLSRSGNTLSIPAAGVTNSMLANSAVTIGSTSVSLGATASSLSGLTSVSATGFTGNLTGDVTGNVSGNAGTVTNGVYSSGSYSNPSWLTALAWSKITGTPTTLGGYGITDALSTTLNSGQILLGNGSNVATAVTPTGDVTISNAGVTAIGTGVVTNAMLAGSIANGKLANSAVTIGSTSVSLGATASSLSGLTSVSATGFTGNLTGDVTGNVSGNAGTVTNGIYSSGSYSNPSWLTALDWSKITGTPTTLSGYGITDGLSTSRTITINGTTLDLSANRSWSVGTVTSVAASGSNGITVSGSPITGSGTISLGLDAITPTSVAASGTVTGSNLSGTNTGDQTITLTGDVTGSGTGSFAATIGSGAVTYSKIQNVAGSRLLGNPSGSATAPSEISLGSGLSFSGSVLNTVNNGTVTSVAASGSNGITVSGSPITGSGTISLGLGAITPTSVAASGTVSGSNLSGTNTGDVSLSGQNYLSISGQTITANAVDLATSNVTGILPVTNGGTGQSSYTNGQLLIGNSTGNTLNKATLTAGSGISITNGAGSITIAEIAPATYQATPANPTGTSSTTGVMMGLAGAITPAKSGRVLIIVSGDLFNASNGNGGTVQIRYGTGTAPANAATLTGTTAGGSPVLTNVGGNNRGFPFSVNAVVSSLNVGTTYWIDLGLAAVAGGTASVRNLSISVVEL